MLPDLLVHERLRVAGVVRLIVTVPPVADHVDDDILLEPLPVIEGDLGGAEAGFRIVAVDVEDGRLHHSRHIGGIRGGTRFLRVGCETDLVIDDQVDGAAVV